MTILANWVSMIKIQGEETPNKTWPPLGFTIPEYRNQM